MTDAPGSAPSTVPASPGGGQLPSDTINQSTTPSNESPGNDFLGLDPGYDDSVETVDIPEQTFEQPEVQTQAQPPSPAPATPETPPVAQPTAQVPQQTQPTTQAAAEPQRTLSEEIEANRDGLIQALASERFALSPHEVEALEADAIEAMPQLLSRVYYETMRSVVNHIQNNVPLMVRQMTDMMRQETSAEDRFFGKFNAIDRAKHAQDVVHFANAFRAQNPRITEDELFTLVGTAVMAKYGLQPRATNGRAAQPQPFVPARPGASVRVTPEEPGPWAGLGMDFDE